MSQTKRVTYFLEEEIGNFDYGNGHPQKPLKIRMTDELILNLQLMQQLQVFRPHPATDKQMTMYHSDDYVEFLRRVNPTNMVTFADQLKKYNLDNDNPVIHDLFQYCSLYTGASLGCAYRINKNLCDIAINWSGGQHHAKKTHAHGFNYINDVVLTILELLKYHKRVLYIDIGVTHGDGVEEAFYATNRVYSLNFHKYGDYFPGTGHIDDIGAERGVNCSLNIPLRSGLTDEQFIPLFNRIVSNVITKYQPNVIVYCCGADNLSCDRLGAWNLTLDSHTKSLELLLGYNLPMILLGGGGYTINNAARCWANNTAVCLGQKLPINIPHNIFYEHYGPKYEFSIPQPQQEDIRENLNTSTYLEEIVTNAMKQIEKINDLPNETYNFTLEQIVTDGYFFNDMVPVNDAGGTIVEP